MARATPARRKTATRSSPVPRSSRSAIRPSLPRKLATLPRRIVKVPGWGTVEVPRYVVRIDSPSTHGWQLRYRSPFKMFSDAVVSRAGTPAASFKVIAQALAEIFEGVHPRLQSVETRRKKVRTGAVGVRRVVRLRRGRNVQEHYFTVSHPKAGVPARNIYIGTENTITPARVKAASERAKKLRAKLVKEFLRDLRG